MMPEIENEDAKKYCKKILNYVIETGEESHQEAQFCAYSIESAAPGKRDKMIGLDNLEV